MKNLKSTIIGHFTDDISHREKLHEILNSFPSVSYHNFLPWLKVKAICTIFGCKLQSFFPFSYVHSVQYISFGEL